MSAQPHSWIFWQLISRKRCKHCGLVWLRNEASDRAARAPCKWWLD